MQLSDIPVKIAIPFGNNAGPSYIHQVPDASQIGIQPGAASFTDGFPPLTFDPVASGGIPPWGKDFNGLLNQMSAWTRWQAAGAQVRYDSAFSTSVGGYPLGAVLQSTTRAGYFWVNLVESNTSDPDAGGANWLGYSVFGPTTGDVKWRPTSEVLPGWIAANALTIGNASSGGTGLASADASSLFAWLWNNFSNSQCPVSGGRGANAAADFAANKNIGLLDLRGRGIFGMDTMAGGATTRLTNVPVISGSASVAGSLLGENLHTLVIAEIAAHMHAVYLNDPGHEHTLDAVSTNYSNGGNPIYRPLIGDPPVSGLVNTNTTGITVRDTSGGGGTANQTALTGGGGAHNTVPQVMLGTWYLKL